MNTDADAMYRLNTTGEDGIEQPIYGEVSFLAMEDDVNQHTFDDHEIENPDSEATKQPKLA